MKLREMKKLYGDNRKYILLFLVSAIFLLGSVTLQSNYQLTGIWEADIEITRIGSGGAKIYRSSISGATISSVFYDFDGDPGTITNMESVGLDPEYHWTVGSFFLTDEYGTPLSSTRSRDYSDVYKIDGAQFIVYYFGFSMSIVTRSDHPAVNPAIFDFDYYGTNLYLSEIPEFASSSVFSEVGIRLNNIDNTIPTDMGVESIVMLDSKKTFTIADSIGYDDNLDTFNYQYNWANYNHKGVVSDPDFKVDYRITDGYASKVSIESIMSPGSEYIIKNDFWGNYLGSSFNVFDVELVVDVLCKVVLNYEILADTGGYLEGRLDLGGTDEVYTPNIFDMLFAFIADIISAFAALLGIDETIALFILMAIVGIGIFILYKIVLGRVRMARRIAFG